MCPSRGYGLGDPVGGLADPINGLRSAPGRVAPETLEMPLQGPQATFDFADIGGDSAGA